MDDRGAEAFSDLDGAVAGAGVDDDDLVDGGGDGFEAAGEHLFFVFDDHAERDGHPLRRTGHSGDAQRSQCERLRLAP